MASRVMISPVVSPRANVYTSKAEQYCDRGCVNFFPSNLDGTPATSFVMTIGRATDWTAAAADPDIQFLFAIPNAVDTPAELKAWLRATKVSDLPAAQRTAMQSVFDSRGIPRADFTLQTPLDRVVRRVASFLFEQDAGFGMGFGY